MASIANLSVISELDAVNTLLATINESKVSSLTDSTQANVEMAVDTLREVAREVLTMGWRFNTEFGYQIAPEDETFEWIDRAGVTTDLNIFQPPSDLIRYEMTPNVDMRCIDAALRDSRYWRAKLAPGVIPTNYALTTNAFSGFESGGDLEDNTDALGGSWTLLANTDDDSDDQTRDSFPVLSGTGVYLPSYGQFYAIRYLSSITPANADYGAEIAIADTRTGAHLASHPDVHIWLRATLDSGGGIDSGYQAVFSFKTSAEDTIGSVKIFKFVSGTPSTLAQDTSIDTVLVPADSDGTHSALGLTVAGGLLTAYINGVSVLTQTDTSPLGDAGAWGIGGAPQYGSSPMVGLYSIAAAAATFSVRENTARSVFYDRANNRDGFDSTRVPFLYITGIFDQDFEAMPQTARNYITRRAARIFYGRVVGEQNASSDTMKDELFALRLLKKDQGMSDNLNVFDAVDSRMYGGRRRYRGGFYDTRKSAGRA